METLKNLGALLDDQHEQGRYESRGFRSAVRRQMKKLCNRYSLQYPPWLDGTGMSVKQFKNRVRWFMEDFVVQQAHQPRPRNATFKSPKSPKSPSGDGLKKAPPTSDGTACAPGDNSSNSSSSSSMNVECPGNPPPATGMEVPSGTVGSADEGPSSASHMMDNLLDDLEPLHPGARQEAQQSVCEGLPAEGTTSELLPEGPASSGLPATGTGLPEEGTAGPSGLPAEGTAVDTEVEDPRKTKSEPPCPQGTWKLMKVLPPHHVTQKALVWRLQKAAGLQKAPAQWEVKLLQKAPWVTVGKRSMRSQMICPQLPV
jgi:hypothetical protein